MIPKPVASCRGAGWLLCACLASGLPAQLPDDGWVFSTRVYLEVADPSFQGLAFVVGSGYDSVTADESGRIMTAWSFRGIQQFAYSAATLSPVALLASLSGGHVVVDRARVWLYDAFNRRIGHVAKDIPSQTPTWLGNIPGWLWSLCFDGRTLYYTIPVDGSSTHHVWAVDLTASPISARPILRLPVGATTRLGRAIALGPDGKLLVMDNSLLLVDPVAGTSTTVSPPPNDPLLFYGNGDVRETVMAYDPWTNTVALGRQHLWDSTVYTQVLGTGTWTLARFLPLEGLQAMASTAERPFELFGRGCNNSTGRDPRMGWRGLPRQGQSFTLTLRDAEPNGFALFWLGVSDSFWAPVGPLPFEASSMGAPGCRMYVSGDVPYFVSVDAAGQAGRSFPVPVNPSLAGWELYAQTVSTSGANNLGLAASDALVIRLR